MVYGLKGVFTGSFRVDTSTIGKLKDVSFGGVRVFKVYKGSAGIL